MQRTRTQHCHDCPTCNHRHVSKENNAIDAGLLCETRAQPNYGSFVNDDEAIQKDSLGSLADMSGIEGERDQKGRGYRCLTARTVQLPPEKWYRRLRIPGVFGYASPHSNAVKTTKYTVLNFLLKNLWEQFHRLANLYFLFIALLNFVPAVEAFGKEVGFVPLIGVLLATAVKDVFEDYRRYRSDKEVNRRVCRVYNWESAQFQEKRWENVCVGDFIQLACDEAIPADILFLHSSDPNGICYIETANVDGENNLKQRQIAPGLVSRINNDFLPQDFTGELHCEQPHNSIYEFNAYIQREDGTRVGVNRSSLLLRGCVLRNTTHIVGIVVYAGHQTKALLNNSGPRAKRSKLERDINVEILSQAGILAVISISGAIVSGVWTARNLDTNAPFFPFLSSEVNPALEGFVRFWTFIILYQVLIPVSLYITIEIVKLIQVYFLNWDRAMYYEPTDKPFQCRALNITEDLGQIQYIFSDKTGTLTENQMVFRCCSIGGHNYPHNLKGQFAAYGTTRANLSLLTSYSCEEEQTDFPQAPAQPLLLDPVLKSAIGNSALNEDVIRDFFLVMALCNTVIVSTTGHGQSANEGGEGGARGVVYEAESPDEASLVEAARSYGYTLISRSLKQCSILTPSGGKLEFEVLHVLEFDPNRKCMSIIVREKDNPDILLLSKGADSAIYSNLAHPSGLLPRVNGPSCSRQEKQDQKQRDQRRQQDRQQEERDEKQSDSSDSATYSSQVPPSDRLSDSFHSSRAEQTPDSAIYSNQAHPSGLLPDPFHSSRAEQTPDAAIYSNQAHPSGHLPDPFHSSRAELCKPEQKDKPRGDVTQQHLDMYAMFGLRTLCMARRVLTEAEYGVWLEERTAGEIALSNRDELLFQSSCSIEKNLELLGATGIEDRLQEGVPEAIQSLREAGLKVWVLTGDKQETAINIGYSSHLLDQDMDVIILNTTSLEQTRAMLEGQRAEFRRQSTQTASTDDQSSGSEDSVVIRSPLLNFSFLKQCEDANYKGAPKALVVNGDTLLFVLDPSLKKLFLDVAKHCQSVICCRAAPSQKAAVVSLVKEKLGQMTLAVGDGANDVSMIHKAHVGVGIAGREGMQAVMASDFAMARFKFLVRLLLVHGHWCYGRLARLMLYYFFKNVAFAMLIFWFQLFNGFSGSNAIDGINLFSFNLVYTGLPIIVVAMADQDLRAETLLGKRSYYEQGRCSKVYTRWKFWLTILDAFYESAVVFFMAYGAYYRSDVGVTEFGFVINTSIVVVVSLHLAVETLHWTVINHLILWGCVVFMFLFNYVYCAIDTQQRFMDTLWVMERASARAEFWFTILLTPAVALFPRVIAKVIELEFFPSPVLAARATEGLLRGRREKAHTTDNQPLGTERGEAVLPGTQPPSEDRGSSKELASEVPTTPSNHQTQTTQRIHCHPL